MAGKGRYKPIILEPGFKFERLTVIRESKIVKSSRFYLCQCECGKTTEVAAFRFRQGRGIQSCGCLRLEKSRASKTKFKETHGMVRTPAYRAWAAMKNRCNSPKKTLYWNLDVCDRWMSSFENFLADMGQPPGPKPSLDRIDNEKGYEPGNCRWATSKQQARNKKKTLFVEFRGEKISVADLADSSGRSYGLVYSRIKRGLSAEEAIRQGGYKCRRPSVMPDS